MAGRSFLGNRKRLDTFGIDSIGNFPGIYVIYFQHSPIYVGRSRVNVKDRLKAHAMKRGNRIIADWLTVGRVLEFACEELMSSEQAEAQLIEIFGTIGLANLRRETDPADW